MANKELEVKVMAALNGNNVEIEEMDNVSSVRIPMQKGIKLISRRPMYNVNKIYSGYAHEQMKKLIPCSRQLATSMFNGNDMITLNFINAIISKEMNHAIDDAAFGRPIKFGVDNLNEIISKEMNRVIDDAAFYKPIKLGAIARLNRLVSRRAKIIGDIGHYFGINTLIANFVYAVDKDGLYRLPISEIRYERMFK